MRERATPTRRSSRMFVGAAAVAGALLLAACAPGSGSPATQTGDGPGVTTDLASLGEITLSVWDQEVRGGQDAQMTRLNAAFEKAYPNIHLQRYSQSNDDLGTTLRLALTGGDPPDVVQANNGRGDMGAFVAAGQLRDLTGYADAYGWADRFPASVLAYSTYSPDGTTFGEGNLYGLPQVGEIVGIFYSRSRLLAAGIDERTLREGDWAGFTAALATAHAAGQTPIMLGNLDAWPAIHVFGPIQAQLADPATIRTLALGNAGAAWTTPENEAAATELQRWVTAGYLNEGPNGTDYDAAWQAFAAGDGTFLIGGSWLAADLATAMGDDVGFMAPPPVKAGSAPSTTGGTGLPFAVTAASPNAAAAAGYLDFITNDEAMRVLAETGNMPVVGTAARAPSSGVNKEVFEAFDAVSTTGHLLPYLDYATPTFGDTLGAALQDLIGGQTTPSDFLQTLQADYGQFTGAAH